MDTKPPFDRIVGEHGPTVYRVCRAVLGSPADAEDAWSETFLSALGAYPKLAAGANIEAWLVTIAHRKAIDVTRRRTREISTDDVPEAPEVVRPPGEPEPELWEALAALPTRQRQAVAYRHLADLTYKQIARIVGGSADAVRRAAADGLAALRRTLPPLDGAPAASPRTPKEGTPR